MFTVDCQDNHVTVCLGETPVIQHSPEAPFLHAAHGEESYHVYNHHWTISDRARQKVALSDAQYDENRQTLTFSGGNFSLTLTLSEEDGALRLTPRRASADLNRLWLNFPVEGKGQVYGGGAQYGELNLRGQKLPLWVYESRIGRESTKLPLLGGSGEHATYFPAPAFFTDTLHYVHIDASCYGFLDFRSNKTNRVELWALPQAITLGVEASYPAVLSHLRRLSGFETELPTWCFEGAWLDVRGGLSALTDTLERMLSAEMNIACLCLFDWSGGRETPQGRQTFLDWIWNRELYPKLDLLLRELSHQNIRTLSYINPHMAVEGCLFAEASLHGYLVRKPEGGNLVSNIGGFMAGHLDLTNPKACRWYQEIIRKNILDLGFAGYFADMGQCLPPTGVLHSGENPNHLHNRWPSLWSRLNLEAVRASGKPDAFFYTSTGFGDAAAPTFLSSTGDHNTSWGRVDGFPSALTAALSLGLSGLGISLCDIGGNRSFLTRRSKELFLRWAEYAAFTPIMKTMDLGPDHADVFTDTETLLAFARLTQVHARLAPYFRLLTREYFSTGLPVMRPLFLVFPGEEALKKASDAFMLGDEMLVAPVFARGRQTRRVLLPQGHWIHLWSGKSFVGGEHVIDAPLGAPPVFYSSTGRFADLFATLNHRS